MGNCLIKTKESERGFSMLEVLFSLGMLGLGLSLVSSFFLQGQQIQLRTRERLDLVLFATQALEEVRSGALANAATFQLHPQRPEFRYRTRRLEAELPEGLGLLEVTVDSVVRPMPQTLFGVVGASVLPAFSQEKLEQPASPEPVPSDAEKKASEAGPQPEADDSGNNTEPEGPALPESDADPIQEEATPAPPVDAEETDVPASSPPTDSGSDTASPTESDNEA